MDACFRDMNEALQAISRAVMTRGEIVSPRGMETREILFCSFVLTNPRARRVTLPSRRWSETLALGEMCWHWAGSNDLQFISYYAKVWERFSANGENIEGSCYGRRIFTSLPGQASQWEMIKSLLRKDPDTRRAVINLSPDDQGHSLFSIDMPCITSVQFMIRSGRLDCITTMRSNDVVWGLCYDVYMVTMLQERLAIELGVPLGVYHHIANSMHVYSEFYEMVERLTWDPPEKTPLMRPMSDVDAIPKFLEVERQLRHGMPRVKIAIQSLSEYWQLLALPLVKLGEKRHS